MAKFIVRLMMRYQPLRDEIAALRYTSWWDGLYYGVKGRQEYVARKAKREADRGA